MSSPLRSPSKSAASASSRSRSPSPAASDPGTPIAGLAAPFDLFGGRPSVHGPALPMDDPSQIYDDFAGELVHNRPHEESDDEDGEEDEDYDTFRGPASDDTIPSEHPESEGLLGLYDNQFAEEQRNLAPLHSLVATDDNDWWCWRSKEECLLDVMTGFPRACFSEKELNATRWYAKKNGVSTQPTIKQVKNHRADILSVAGLNTKLLDGKLGNAFAINDWFTILKHEFANPLIRPKLHLYPEDTGKRLGEARQAAKWRVEVDGNISGPMARGNGGKDYYVEEVCFARLDVVGNVGPVMPMRWFVRDGKLLSTAHPLRLTESQHAFVIDGRDVACIELPLESYFLNVSDLQDPDCQIRYGIPPPSQIAGILRNDTSPLEKWTQPSINKWRTKAAGRRVHSVPLWTYCDDTSGNVSKKWNKHNSILFTLAGLPRELTQMLYNIHFIATVPTITSLDVFLRAMEAQEDGIEVWDCDNPMSSEFASHVGMKGKHFCRICKAKSDKGNRAPGHAGEIDRLTDFMTAGVARTKEGTVADLTAQLQRAIDGAPSAVDEMATESGSKDKYFQHFLEKLQAAATKLREEQKERGSGPSEAGLSKAEEVKNMLHQLRATMPEELFNPVLSIPDFDANSDTPVEILHVVLLGVVKYWWRDAVSRQNSKGKEELKARLSSVDLAGLNVNTPTIRGHTYVQYAGSLVGRDFRVILQVALVVLHGLIPQAHYEGWVALCKLAPLMFQPVIEDMTLYLKKLNEAVFDFLAATALWNTQWFNKPKFHSFVHIVEHIRRFGPLILFATESFESFNLVIRLRSIHSSKHAPSVDIATAFSHLHAVRHLVSGGFVLSDEDGNRIAPRQAGPEVLALLDDEEFRGFMSMTGLAEASKSDALPYRLPSCIVQPHRCVMIAFTEVQCTVNVNHNCAAHQCKTTLTRPVIQERRQTTRFENEVVHTTEPNDCFLNLAQLRNATDVQCFRSGARYPDLPLAEVIEQSVRIKERLERETKDTEAAKEVERIEKAQGKEAKAKAKEHGTAKKADGPSKRGRRVSEGGPQDAAESSTQGRKRAGEGRGIKRKKADEDCDFAEGGEELVYVPQPSKSRRKLE
ncbi:hypothetical protein C8R46DRAFT_1313390 [Mycena filopes]|nr:hypothetical protein C8R46DRAFT_1313390 [Mycena filopes]